MVGAYVAILLGSTDLRCCTPCGDVGDGCERTPSRVSNRRSAHVSPVAEPISRQSVGAHSNSRHAWAAVNEKTGLFSSLLAPMVATVARRLLAVLGLTVTASALTPCMRMSTKMGGASARLGAVGIAACPLDVAAQLDPALASTSQLAAEQLQ